MLFLPSVVNSLSGCSAVLCSTARKLTADVKTCLSVTSNFGWSETPYSIHCLLLLVKCLMLWGRNAEGFSLDEIHLKNLHCAKGWAKTVQEHQEFWGMELTWVAGEMWLLGQYETSEPCAGRTSGVLNQSKEQFTTTELCIDFAWPCCSLLPVSTCAPLFQLLKLISHLCNNSPSCCFPKPIEVTNCWFVVWGSFWHVSSCFVLHPLYGFV